MLKLIELQAQKIPNNFNSGITGIHFLKIQARIYPKGDLASHILGNVSKDGEGLAGIERNLILRLSLLKSL